jgi:hypothetical protein
VRPGAPAQLEVTTRVDRERKGVKRVAVYQAAAGASGVPADPTATERESPSR